MADEQVPKAQRMSTEQRVKMLEFMKEHPALATNKFTMPDGVKHKARLLKQLASELNSMPNGATKSEERWLKSWQDWRSDTKGKAAKIRRYSQGTGGGPPCKQTLSKLEENLLDFLGAVAVTGHDVLDPLDAVTGTAGSSTSTGSSTPPGPTGTVVVTQSAITGCQIGQNFILALEPLTEGNDNDMELIENPISTPASISLPSNEVSAGETSGPSSLSSGSRVPTPASHLGYRRKRGISDSSCEEKLVSISEDSAVIRKRKLAVVEAQLDLQKAQVEIQRSQLDLLQKQTEMQERQTEIQERQTEMQERFVAAFETIALALAKGNAPKLSTD